MVVICPGPSAVPGTSIRVEVVVDVFEVDWVLYNQKCY